MHWNPNSIKNKYYEFLNFINVNKPDLISLNETKINNNNEFFIPNYKIIRKDRSR